MASTQTLTDKILSDAKAQADAALEDARAKADKLISDTKASLAKSLEAAITAAKKESEEQKRRAVSAAELSARQELLAARQSAISGTFAEALRRIKDLPEADYKNLIAGMIAKYGEDEDTVTVARDDQRVINALFIDSIAKKKRVELQLNKLAGDFSGGVVISSASCDKNLTLEVELEELRAEIEPRIADMLFGDTK